MSEMELTKSVLDIEKEGKKRGSLTDVLRRLIRRKPMGVVGAVIVLVMLFAGIFAGLLAPYPYDENHLVDRLEPPGNPRYLLGTDGIGRDILSRIIYGARVSMIVGLAATAISVLESTIIGIFSGFLGGKADLTIQRFVDAWMCLPGLIIMMTIMSLVGTGMWQLIIVLGMGGGIGGSRVVRSAVISIKEKEYVQAARAVGSSTRRTLVQHILPNIFAPIIILFSAGVGGAILAEASLSFLGYGIPPPMPSWGNMLSGEGRMYMLRAPWMALWPGLALSVAVFGINMLGDAIRDLLDPRLRGGVGRYSGAKRRISRGS